MILNCTTNVRFKSISKCSPNLIKLIFSTQYNNNKSIYNNIMINTKSIGD